MRKIIFLILSVLYIVLLTNCDVDSKKSAKYYIDIAQNASFAAVKYSAKAKEAYENAYDAYFVASSYHGILVSICSGDSIRSFANDYSYRIVKGYVDIYDSILPFIYGCCIDSEISAKFANEHFEKCHDAATECAGIFMTIGESDSIVGYSATAKLESDKAIEEAKIAIEEAKVAVKASKALAKVYKLATADKWYK